MTEVHVNINHTEFNVLCRPCKADGDINIEQVLFNGVDIFDALYAVDALDIFDKKVREVFK